MLSHKQHKHEHSRKHYNPIPNTIAKKNAIITTIILILLTISTITLAMANAATTNAGPVGGTIADNLDGDYAHATILRVDNVSSGTAPWDTDDTAGNDSTPDNDIIRSFDTARYDIHSVFDVKQDSPYAYIANGYVGYKVVITGYDTNGTQLDMSKKRAWFDEESLGWVSTDKGYEKSIGVEKINGHDCVVLTCWRRLEGTDAVPTVIPGNKDITFSIKVNQMLQGQKVVPEFYAFADHNTPDEYAHITGKSLTVSSAPRLNIGITKADDLDAGYGNFDFSDGNETAPNRDAGIVTGRRSTHGIYVEIRNNLAGKQMRGVEVPVGGITFDVTLNTKFRSKSADGKTLSDWSDETDDYTPLVWFVDSNKSANIRSNGRNYASKYGGSSTTYHAFNIPGSNFSTTTPGAGCNTYHDANWNGTQSGNIVHVTLDDTYLIDMISTWTTVVTPANTKVQAPYFPWSAVGYDIRTSFNYYNPADGIKERAIFCAGMLSIIQPFDSNKDGTSILDKHSCTDGDFALTSKLSNLRATTESGASLPHVTDNSNQVITTDDSVTATVNVRKPGEWMHYIHYTTPNYPGYTGTDGYGWSGNSGNGSDSAIAGSNVMIHVECHTRPDDLGNVEVLQRYVAKFDSDKLVPDDDQIAADLTQKQVNDATPHNAFNRGGSVGSRDGDEQFGILGDGYATKKNDYVIVRYLAKPDGSKWASTEEMSGYDTDSLIAYSSLKTLQAAGKTCVAIAVETYIPARGTYLARRDYANLLMFKTLTTAPDGSSNINTVAATSIDARMWTRQSLVSTAFPGQNVNDVTAEQWLAYDQQLLAKAKVLPDGTAMSATDYAGVKYKACPVYKKETYNANGKLLGTHSGGCHDGDSLLIVGEQAQITIGTEQTDKNTQKPKSIYDIDYEQRYADYYADATLTTNANLAANVNTTLYYTITLPKGQTYLDGSLTYGGTYTENTPNPGTTTGGTKITPTLTKNADGTSTLAFSVPGVKADGSDIKRVHYTVMLGDTTDIDNDVKNGDQQTTTASIQSTNDRRKPTPSWGNIFSTVISIAKLRQQSLTNSILLKINEVNTEYTLTDTIGNYGNGQVMDMYGVTRMPWNGTGSLSAYNGTYTVTSMTLDTSKIADATDVSFYFTTDEKYRTGTYAGTNGLKKITNAETLGWSKAGYDPTTGKITIPAGVDPSKIVAWSMHKDILDKNDRMYVTTTIQPTGNAPADYYAQELTDGENTVRDIAYVASRSITGTVWKDENKDGTRQASEPVFGGLKVTLVDKDGKTVNSVLGSPLETITGDDGNYAFDGVPAGDYFVKFSGDALGNYSVTTKDVTDAGGMNDDTVDSDVAGYANAGRLDSMLTGAITMPALKDMTSYHYAKEHVDAGVFLNKLGIEISKVSDNGTMLAGAKLELRDDAGNAVDSWTSTASVHKKDGILAPGARYTIVETSAPDGYVVASPISFVAPSDGSVSVVKRTMTDRVIKAATVSFSVTKRLSGAEIGNRCYTFELRDASGNLLQTAQNDSSGNVAFSPISIGQVGTSKFTIVERNDKQGGVTYDDHQCQVTVTSTADMLGQLHTNTTYSGREFANAYSASPTDVPVTALKVLNVGGGSSRTLKKDEFSFELRETTGGKDELLQTVQNDAAGVVAFTPLHFDSAGEHSYSVREVRGDDGTVTYDDTVKSFTVDVSDNGKGKLVASASGNTQDNLRFVNSYEPKPASVSLPVRKVVDTGDTGEALNNGEFSFVLSGSDGSVLQTVQNAADGSVPFAPLSFDHVGVFKFTVSEVNGHLVGWSYDASLFYVRVSVSDDGSGQLKADTVITKRAVSADVAEDDAPSDDAANATDDADAQPVDVIEFSNSYAVSPVSVRLGTVKTLSGDFAGKPGNRRFSFELHETTGGKDVLLQTEQNDDDGLVKFNPVSFSSPGEHTFSIREVADRKVDGNVSYSFDDTTHVVKVSVTNGHDGLLHAVVTYDEGTDKEDTADTGTGADTDSALGGVNEQLVSSSLGNDASVVSVVGDLPVFVNGTVVIAQSMVEDYGDSAVPPVQNGSVPVPDVVQSSDSDAVVQTGDGLVGVSVVAIISIVIMLAIAAARRRAR